MITQSPTLFESPDVALSSLSRHELIVTTRLTNDNESEVLGFLAEHPLHNVIMLGMIGDNGVESKFNRGTFYGCRNAVGRLVGVALMGHAVFIDARCDEALRRFAKLAQAFPRTHMLMGEKELIERFWRYYAPNGQPERRICREILFELNEQPIRSEYVANLRLARLSDLSRIVPVHAAMSYEQSGVHPLQRDPSGFRQRCERRIENGRTWVLFDRDQLIFKTEVVSDTPDAIYLEGVYVHPEYRRGGIGTKCLARLTDQLLGKSKSISVLVDEERAYAQEFFRKLGFIARGCYDTWFLQTQAELS